MSRQLRAFTGGRDRRIATPFVKQGGAWTSASKIYRKETGAWVEWWPLLPDPPTDVRGNFPYRNGNIELDVYWNEPVGGPEVTSYRIGVWVDDRSSVGGLDGPQYWVRSPHPYVTQSVVGTSTTSTVSPSVTLTAPPQEGDVIVMWLARTTTAVLNVAPSGWVNALGGTTIVNSDAHSLACVYHVVTAEEAEAETVTYACTGLFTVAAATRPVTLVVRHAESVSPATSLFNSTNATTHVLPGATPTETGGLLLGAVAKDTTGTYTPPSGWTNVATANTTCAVWAGSYDTLTTEGEEIASTNITPSAGDEYASISLVMNPVPASPTPPVAWQQYAGKTARISVEGISPFGDYGKAAWSPAYIVPQLPPPDAPTDVSVAIVNRGARASWSHVEDNRVYGFDIRTSYQGRTVARNNIGGSLRSTDITFWDTSGLPGDPGGQVGFLIRAVGPGGSSSWVGVSGAVPSVPNPPPPPAVALPGTPHITNTRFLNGQLRCDYSIPNAATARVWWERLGGGAVYYGTVGSGSGSVTIAGSEAWARDDVNVYRFHIEGVNSAGQPGVTSYGPWVRKLPNPYYIVPSQFMSFRGDEPDIYAPLSARQGSSYNEINYRSPIIQWRTYTAYPKDRLSGDRVGYSPTITSAEILLWRENRGGSGQSVRPRLWWHGYQNVAQGGLSLSGDQDLLPLLRNEAKWHPVDVAYARRLANSQDSGVTGIALYHPNTTLLSWLGEVSAEYMFLFGPFTNIYGVPMFTIKVEHDG